VPLFALLGWHRLVCPHGLASGKPHPRNFGTFAKVLGQYARDEKIITLEEAVAKMTGMPARRMRLTDRGLVKVGLKADLVVFDPEGIIDTSTYEEPRRHPRGIRHVFVNGEHAVREGEILAARAGRVLRR